MHRPKVFILFCLIFNFLSLSLLQNSFSQTEFTQRKPEYDPKHFKSKKEFLWILKAYEFAKRGELPKALELIEKAIELNPTGSSHLWKAAFHEQLAQKMIRQWHQASRSQPKALDADSIQQHYLISIQSYQKGIELFPGEETLYYLLGNSYLDYLNEPSKAEEYFLKVFQMTDQKGKSRLALARTYLQLKRYGEARKEAEATIQDGNIAIQSEAHLILGRIEMEQKNFSRAIEELSLSLSLDPGRSFARYFLAKAHLAMGQPELAQESYKKFLRFFAPLTLNDLKLIEESKRDLEQMESENQKGKKG